jgi:CheY-like chemotaxis protein
MPTFFGRGVAIGPTDGLASAGRPLVLLVDPDAETCGAGQRILATAGVRVAAARTGFEAIVKASCHLPDVIVMHVIEPGPDGLDGAGTVELLRTCPSTAHIPVVELSNGAARSRRRLLRELEALLPRTRVPGSRPRRRAPL